MILYRYIFKEYLRLALYTLTLCSFLFILFDVIHKTGNYFAKYKPSISLITSYYLYQLPFQLIQVMPIAALLASILLITVLVHNNEISSMRAAGLSPIQITIPFACGGLVLSIFAFILNELVIPQTSQKMHYISKVLIEGAPDNILNKGLHWLRYEKHLLHFKHYNPKTHRLENITVIGLDKSFQIKTSLHAKAANYKSGLWHLEHSTSIKLDNDGKMQFNPGPKTLNLPLTPEKLLNDPRLPEEISLRELSPLIEQRHAQGGETTNLRLAWHLKCAYPLASLILSLIGIGFAYRSGRKLKTIRTVILAFLIGSGYWFILSSNRALALAGNIDPMLAAWSANILLAGIICRLVYTLYRPQRG